MATEILHLRDEAGWSLSDQAILFRTNAQSRPYERALVERRIPYHLVGGLRFWDRREIKDAVAYLRFASNPRDAVAFDRIANVPRRRISDRTAQAAIQAASDGGGSIWTSACGRTRFRLGPTPGRPWPGSAQRWHRSSVRPEPGAPASWSSW